MPFKDTSDGQTHFENDGCGDAAHNPMLKSFLQESEREFDEIDDKKYLEYGVGLNKDDCKSFTSSKLRQLIEEVRKGVEGMKKEPLKDGSRIIHKVLRAKQQGANAALDSVLALLSEFDNTGKK